VSGGFSPSILTAIQHASMCSKTLSFQSSTPAKPKAPKSSASSAPSQPQAQSSSTSNSTFADKQLPVATLLYLATLGGAHVCALESRIGSFAPGKAFDALVASTRAECGNPAVWGPDVDDALGLVRERGGADGVDETVVENKKQQLESVLERFLFGGDDRNIRRVYVEGRLIGGAAR
jgi:guanine deaminase